MNDKTMSYHPLTTPASVPELPSEWKPPFSVFGWQDSYAVTNGDDERTAIIDGLRKGVAEGIATLMNTIYLPGGLRDQLAERDAEIERLKTALSQAKRTPFYSLETADRKGW